MPISDLQRAFDTLTTKTRHYSTLWAYYSGQAPLVYTNERLRDIFQSREARFSENWCAVVVDAEHERIRLKEFTLPELVLKPKLVPKPVTDTPVNGTTPEPTLEAPTENPLQTRLNDLFSETELNLDSDDVHKAALVCGEAYVCAWKDSDTGEIEAYYHDPRMTHVFYDPEHPRRKAFAAKWWIGEADEKRYLNLYYRDRIEYYASTQKVGSFSSYKGLQPFASDEHESVEDNPFREIPVFHFRTDRRKNTSRLENVIEPQDALNKLFADMMVSAEFGAFMQRWIISNGDLDVLKSAPNENWVLPAASDGDQPTSVGQFAPADLNNYLNAIDKLANAIAIITRTPKHYVFAQGGDPSGEALIAMEAPLNKKAQGAIDRMIPTWQEVAAFLLKLDGTPDVPKRDLTPTFAKPETVQPRTAAEIRQMDVSSGIPLETVLRREGWAEAELAALRQDKATSQSNPAAMTDEDVNAVTETFKRLGIPDMLDDVDMPVSTRNANGATARP